MKVRVNITVDPTLWKQFRVLCLQNDTTASAEFDAFMRARVEKSEQKGGKKK
jgi:hypothetical protein